MMLYRLRLHAGDHRKATLDTPSPVPGREPCQDVCLIRRNPNAGPSAGSRISDLRVSHSQILSSTTCIRGPRTHSHPGPVHQPGPSDTRRRTHGTAEKKFKSAFFDFKRTLAAPSLLNRPTSEALQPGSLLSPSKRRITLDVFGQIFRFRVCPDN